MRAMQGALNAFYCDAGCTEIRHARVPGYRAHIPTSEIEYARNCHFVSLVITCYGLHAPMRSLALDSSLTSSHLHVYVLTLSVHHFSLS